MNDTVRIERPMFSRRMNDDGGRVKLDPRGNLILVKTRASDAQEIPDLAAPALEKHALPAVDTAAAPKRPKPSL